MVLSFQETRGLSPLARGTLCRRLFFAQVHRFIPAGAGNTPRFRMRLAKCAVYPRWRGEHQIRQNNAPLYNGLSPLARGTRFFQYDDATVNRFIPAGAGNTRTESKILTEFTVYPRWRGEHTKHT